MVGGMARLAEKEKRKKVSFSYAMCASYFFIVEELPKWQAYADFLLRCLTAFSLSFVGIQKKEKEKSTDLLQSSNSLITFPSFIVT